MQIKREKPEFTALLHSSLGRTQHASKDHTGEATRSIIRQKGNVGNKHLYRGFCGKESTRQGKEVWDSLTGISSSGSGADRLSLVVWHLALGQLKQVYGVLEYDHPI